MLDTRMREENPIQSHYNELRVKLDLNKFEFVVNGISTQRTDRIERVKHLEKRLMREKKSLSRCSRYALNNFTPAKPKSAYIILFNALPPLICCCVSTDNSYIFTPFCPLYSIYTSKKEKLLKKSPNKWGF